MTSTPVKDVSSLMNFVGSRQTVSSGKGAESFGDVMSKASESRQSAESVNSAKDVKEGAAETRIDKSAARPERTRVEKSDKQTVTDETQAEAEEAAVKAGEELLKEIADVLNVSEEEILDRMEELGFGMTALLNAENLTQLVLTLTGTDSVSLLTDGDLYNSLQSLLQSRQELTTGICADFAISQEDLEQILNAMNMPAEIPDDSLAVPETVQVTELPTAAAEEETVPITVTVEEDTQSVTVTTDEKGNVKQVETVVTKETEGQNDTQEETKGQQSQTEDGNELMPGNNPLLGNGVQNKVITPEMSFENAAAYITADTEEIMNQIMDYMKIQLSPGMDQLEMQLHPESLGTVKIQLTSQGGEVTAQFQVQNETVKAIIESQIVELKETLKNQGVVVEAVEVSVESHAFESNLWQGQGREEDASYQGNRKSPRRIQLDHLEEGFEELASEEEILAAKMMEANGNTVDYTV